MLAGVELDAVAPCTARGTSGVGERLDDRGDLDLAHDERLLGVETDATSDGAHSTSWVHAVDPCMPA